jgi:hypothetical protein
MRAKVGMPVDMIISLLFDEHSPVEGKSGFRPIGYFQCLLMVLTSKSILYLSWKRD